MTPAPDLLHMVRTGEMPPGGFSYVVPETGITIGKPPMTCLDDLCKAVLAHYVANRLTPPSNLAALVEDNVCRRLGPSWCESTHGVPWTKNAGLPAFSFAQVKQATHTLLSWFREGFAEVPVAQMESRATTCLSCPMHAMPDGCSACNMADIFSLVVTGHRLPTDTSLKACRVCGCSLRVKTKLPLATILKHTPALQLAAFPQNCWIVRERAEAPP